MSLAGLKGFRILAKVAVRAYMRRQEAGSDAAPNAYPGGPSAA